MLRHVAAIVLNTSRDNLDVTVEQKQGVIGKPAGRQAGGFPYIDEEGRNFHLGSALDRSAESHDAGRSVHLVRTSGSTAMSACGRIWQRKTHADWVADPLKCRRSSDPAEQDMPPLMTDAARRAAPSPPHTDDAGACPAAGFEHRKSRSNRYDPIAG